MEVYVWDTLNRKLDAILTALGKLNQQGASIMATQADLTKQLNTLSDQVAKVGGETARSLQMIADLQAQLAAGGPITPELQAAVDKLAAQLKTVDDLVPDAPVTP